MQTGPQNRVVHKLRLDQVIDFLCTGARTHHLAEAAQADEQEKDDYDDSQRQDALLERVFGTPGEDGFDGAFRDDLGIDDV